MSYGAIPAVTHRSHGVELDRVARSAERAGRWKVQARVESLTIATADSEIRRYDVATLAP